jgi:hypothetical protein
MPALARSAALLRPLCEILARTAGSHGRDHVVVVDELRGGQSRVLFDQRPEKFRARLDRLCVELLDPGVEPLLIGHIDPVVARGGHEALGHPEAVRVRHRRG